MYSFKPYVVAITCICLFSWMSDGLSNSDQCDFEWLNDSHNFTWNFKNFDQMCWFMNNVGSVAETPQFPHSSAWGFCLEWCLNPNNAVVRSVDCYDNIEQVVQNSRFVLKVIKSPNMHTQIKLTPAIYLDGNLMARGKMTKAAATVGGEGVYCDDWDYFGLTPEKYDKITVQAFIEYSYFNAVCLSMRS